MNAQAPIAPPGDNSNAVADLIKDLIKEHGLDTILSVYIASHQDNMDKLVKRATDLKAAAERAVIDNQEKADNGANVLKMITVLESAADDDKKVIKKPILGATRTIDAVFKSIDDNASKAKTEMKKKLGKFEADKEAKAEAERRELAAKAAAAQKAAEEAAAAGSATEAQIAQQQAETLAEQAVTYTAPKTRSAAGASVHTRKTRKWEVIDHALVNPDWWKIDDDKVDAAVKGLSEDDIKAGNKLPGIRTWIENEIVGR